MDDLKYTPKEVPRYLTLNDVINMVDNNKIEVLEFFQVPQLRLLYDNMNYYYRLNQHHYELYTYAKST